MNIQLSGQHLEITDSIRNSVKEKIKRLQQHFNEMMDIHVNLKVERARHTAEATIHVRGHTLFATTDHDDMYVAIDDLVNKLNHQIVKHKEKLKNHHKKEVVHHKPRK